MNDAMSCHRCSEPMQTANVSTGGFSFAGRKVRVLVCRKCGHVEMIAEEPESF